MSGDGGSTSFGIHMGNTSACIAVSKEGKTDVVANDAGDRVTPAMVGFNDSEMMVGLAAKQSRIRNLTNTITNNKIYIKQSAESGVEDIWSGNPVTVTKDEDKNKIQYEVDYLEKESGHKVSPSEILTSLYRYMHDIAAAHVRDVDSANSVITVPLDWTAEERQLAAQAASKAGFRVVQVISEPVAACLAHGLEQVPDRRYIMVYRAGGISVTATILLVSGGCYSVVDSIDLRSGGGNVTDVLVNYLGREFRTKYKEDILVNKRGRAKLAVEAEKVKHVLSTLDTAHCFVESLFDGMDFSTNVTRARFDNEISKAVSDLLSPVSQMLTRCKLTHSDISHLVLSGGTSKVVKIQKQLASMFPEAELHTNIAPDECTAFGAAVQASYITKELNVGIKEKMMAISGDIVANSPLLENGKLTLVPSDSTIPVKRSLPLTLSSGEGHVDVQLLLSGEVNLGTLSLDIQADSKLFLAAHIHRDGASHFSLTDKTSGKSADIHLKPSASQEKPVS